MLRPHLLRPHRVMIGSIALWIAIGASGVPASADQTVVVVLDDSGSMERVMPPKQRRIAAAKEALATVLAGLPYDTQVGILALNSTVNNSHWIVPVGSPDPNRWQQPLQHVRAKGGTPLGAFMRQAADELLALRAKQPFSTYRLLVVTDGEATDAALLTAILPDMLSRGINLDVIGVGMAEEHSLARSAHSYRRAGDQAALAQALSEVFAETVGDSQSSQADFELLSGLSDEAAAAIVKGLTAPRNDPLQIITPDPDLPDTISMPSGGPNFPVGTAGRSGSTQSVGGAIVSSLCCVGVFGVTMLIAALIILRAVKNKSRR